MLKLTKILLTLLVLFSSADRSSGQTSWSFFQDANSITFGTEPRVTYNNGLFHLAWQSESDFNSAISHITTDGNSTDPSAIRTEFDLGFNFSYQFENFAVSPTGDLLFIGEDFRTPSLAVSDLPDTGLFLNEFQDWPFFEDGVATAIAFGNGHYVTTFSGGTSFSEENTFALASSDDLNNWEYSTLPVGLSLNNVIFDNGLFVAVGNYTNREDFSSTEQGAILTSVDGQQWSFFLTQTTTRFHDLIFDGAEWIVVGENSSIWKSSDGYVWQEGSSPSGSINLTAVAVGNDYLVLGSEDGTILSSTDGISFTQQDQFSGRVSDIEVGNGMFVAAVGTHYVSSPFSPDGIADIIEHPESQFFIAEEQITLTVTAIGDGPLSYQWFIGERGDTSNPIIGATSSTYQTPPLTSSQNYWVQVSNSIGLEESLTASITLVTTPTITQQPVGFIANMGTFNIVRVTASGNDLSYQWYEGFSGDTSLPVPNSRNSTFFPPSDFPGTFNYWVRVSNSLGHVDSATIEVEILPSPPVIILQPQDLTVPVGNFLGDTLYVDAAGPSLSYQWYEGVSGDTSSPIPGRTSSWYSPSTSVVGTFQYWVRVSNGAGFEDSETSNFEVTPLPPIITRQPIDQSISEGESAQLSVGINGFRSSTTYQWYEGESGDTSSPLSFTFSSITLSNLSLGDHPFWVSITNPDGTANSNTAIIRVTPNSYISWLRREGLPENATGTGAPEYSQNGNFPNLLRYALGANLSSEPSDFFSMGTMLYEGENVPTLQFTMLNDLPDVTLEVEETVSLNTSWTTTAVLVNTISMPDNRTHFTYRISDSDIKSTSFLRLNATLLSAP